MRGVTLTSGGQVLKKQLSFYQDYRTDISKPDPIATLRTGNHPSFEEGATDILILPRSRYC